MTKEELEDMLHVMGLDYEAEADKIYVFYVHPDGRVDNFSISVRHGRAMSNGDIEELMRREYPSTREGTVMAVERPHGHVDIKAQEHSELPKEEWLDTVDVCQMLKISRRTLQRWTRKGLFRKVKMEDRNYYSRHDIDEVMHKNMVQENGHIDTSQM